MELVAILAIVAVLLIGEQVIFRKYVLRGVTYTVRFSKHEACEGEKIEIIEEIINDKRLPVPWAKTELCTSRWLEFSGTSASRASDTRFVPSVFALRPRQKCTRTRTVTATKRGLFRLENATLIASDLLGIVTVSRAIQIDEEVRILPAPYEVAEGDMSDRELYGEILTRRFICDDPFLISGAREYTGREPMNRIHWAGTARTGRLMAFNNDYTTTQKAAVVMNMQRSPIGDPHPVVIGDEETYIKAAAFLMEMFVERGVSTCFMTNGSSIAGIRTDSENTADGCTRILRVLSELENLCYRDICDFLDAQDFFGITDIVIITHYIDERLILFAQKMRRFQNINVLFYCNDTEGCDEKVVRVGRISKYYYAAEM